MYASVGEGLGTCMPPPLKRSRNEKAKAPRILAVKLAEPPQEDAQSRGQAQLPSIILGSPVDLELLPPDFGVRDLATTVESNMGVTTNFVICDRHGPIVDSESTHPQCRANLPTNPPPVEVGPFLISTADCINVEFLYRISCATSIQ